MNDEQEKLQALSQKSQPVKTWFIERGDGFIFACDEAEAWGLFENRTNWMRKDFKIIGVSDGTAYFAHIAKNKNRAIELQDELTKIEYDYDRYTKTEDRLRFEELLDETDEKVLKVGAIRKDLLAKINDIRGKLENINKDVIGEAFNIELEKARGNIEYPSNHDVITPGIRDRDRILSALGQRK
jgi:hypothetical protein